ncbi:hypothetical protein Btru_063291 [Bulinus truncatus]|nr:hypothetical protein Btru_063291 [Bulinus truncatus]
MNMESSRSLAVLTIMIESKEDVGGDQNKLASRLNLVDLAGSERQKETKAGEARPKEAGTINKSLFVLGKVIMSLVDISHGKKRHIPYRDSKLTFFLRDFLGGNTKTRMIACVHPDSRCFGETLSTLNFAKYNYFNLGNNQENHIHSMQKASKGFLEIEKETLVQSLRDETKVLREQLAKYAEENKHLRSELKQLRARESLNNINSDVSRSAHLERVFKELELELKQLRVRESLSNIHSDVSRSAHLERVFKELKLYKELSTGNPCGGLRASPLNDGLSAAALEKHRREIKGYQEQVENVMTTPKTSVHSASTQDQAVGDMPETELCILPKDLAEGAHEALMDEIHMLQMENGQLKSLSKLLQNESHELDDGGQASASELQQGPGDHKNRSPYSLQMLKLQEELIKRPARVVLERMRIEPSTSKWTIKKKVKEPSLSTPDIRYTTITRSGRASKPPTKYQSGS